MKRLCLIRHAKSAWDSPGLVDFDRPLNEKGRHDANFMGKEILKHMIPELIISSSAKRTKETTALLLQSFNNGAKVIYEDRLYEASIQDILNVIAKIEDNIKNLFLIAHNPGIHALIEYLSSESLTKMPTCAAAFLKTDAKKWSELQANSMDLELFIYPKLFE